MSISLFWYIPPDETMIRGQIEYLKETGNQAPRRQRGDKFPIAGVLAGIIAGFIIALTTGILWIFIAGPIAGGIIGAFLGSVIGALVTKYRRPKGNLRYY